MKNSCENSYHSGNLYFFKFTYLFLDFENIIRLPIIPSENNKQSIFKILIEIFYLKNLCKSSFLHNVSQW